MRGKNDTGGLPTRCRFAALSPSSGLEAILVLLLDAGLIVFLALVLLLFFLEERWLNKEEEFEATIPKLLLPELELTFSLEAGNDP